MPLLQDYEARGLPEVQIYLRLTSKFGNIISSVQEDIAITSASVVTINCHVAEVCTVLQSKIKLTLMLDMLCH